MGQEGIPMSIAILFGLVVLGVVLSVGMIVASMFLA
jgi:hypothetical protein